MKKDRKFGRFFEKVPIVNNIMKYFRKGEKEPEALLEEPKKLETETVKIRKAIMAEAIQSSSQTLIADEARFREALSQEEYDFYLKSALTREGMEQARQKAINTKVPTYTELIRKAREDANTPKTDLQENVMAEEQKEARMQLRKTVMDKVINSSAETIKANELELKKVLSQEEYNWYLKEALRRENIENIRQKAITVQNQQLSNNKNTMPNIGNEIPSGSVQSRRKSLTEGLRVEVNATTCVQTYERGNITEDEGRIA